MIFLCLWALTTKFTLVSMLFFFVSFFFLFFFFLLLSSDCFVIQTVKSIGVALLMLCKFNSKIVTQQLKKNPVQNEMRSRSTRLFGNFWSSMANVDAKRAVSLKNAQCWIRKVWKNHRKIVRKVTLEFYAPIEWNTMCERYVLFAWVLATLSKSIIDFSGPFHFCYDIFVVCCCAVCVRVFFPSLFIRFHLLFYCLHKWLVKCEKKQHWQHVVNPINSHCCRFLKQISNSKIVVSVLFFTISRIPTSVSYHIDYWPHRPNDQQQKGN